MDSKNSIEADAKMEVGDLSSNLDVYFGSKCMSTNKDNVEDSKDKKNESNVGLEALQDEEG